MARITLLEARTLVAAALRAAGANAVMADATARALVLAEAQGLGSHGLSRVGQYSTQLRHGDAYFYVPKFPFAGEVETYNFLFNLEYWKGNQTIGIVSPVRTFNIINANDKFASHSKELDKLIKETLALNP